MKRFIKNFKKLNKEEQEKVLKILIQKKEGETND